MIVSPVVAAKIQRIVAVKRGLVRLSSSFKGIISKAAPKSPKKKALARTGQKLFPGSGIKIKKQTSIVLKRKAAEPSKLFPSTILCFPYLIPIIALRGSATAKVKIAVRAIDLGKVMIVNKRAIRYGIAADSFKCSSALRKYLFKMLRPG